LKSTDGGVSWTPLSISDSPRRIFAFVVDPTASAAVYAATTFGVRKSVDGGATWTWPSNEVASRRILPLAVSRSTPSVLWAGTEYGTFKSVDAAEAWTSADEDLMAARIDALAADPTDRRVAYSSAFGLGVFKTSNAGLSWVRAGAFITDRVLLLAVIPIAPNIVYAGTGTGIGTNIGAICKSVDGGGTWAIASARHLRVSSLFDCHRPAHAHHRLIRVGRRRQKHELGRLLELSAFREQQRHPCPDACHRPGFDQHDLSWRLLVFHHSSAD